MTVWSDACFASCRNTTYSRTRIFSLKFKSESLCSDLPWCTVSGRILYVIDGWVRRECEVGGCRRRDVNTVTIEFGRDDTVSVWNDTTHKSSHICFAALIIWFYLFLCYSFVACSLLVAVLMQEVSPLLILEMTLTFVSSILDPRPASEDHCTPRSK